MAEGKTRTEIEARIVARAWADPDYKRLLSTDPRQAIRLETGVDVPGDIEITVLEETPTHGYLVIPSNEAELSDETLENVAAGFTFRFTFCFWGPPIEG